MKKQEKKIISTRLYTKGSADVNEKVVADLKIPDDKELDIEDVIDKED